MEQNFLRRVLGYDMDEVDKYIAAMKEDYEERLLRKKERLNELCEENKRFIERIEELKADVARYKEKQESVGIALIKAEETAKNTIAQAELKKQSEIDRIAFEARKWEDKAEVARHELLQFEEMIIDLLEKYQEEVNYLASKDVKKKYFKEEKSA